METGDAILFGVVAALAVNSVLFFWPGWDRRRVLFYAVQATNLVVATFLMAVGVPTLDGSLEVFNWVLGGLFIVRILTNNKRYTEALRERRRGRGAAATDKRQALAAALRRGERRGPPGSSLGSAASVPVDSGDSSDSGSP